MPATQPSTALSSSQGVGERFEVAPQVERRERERAELDRAIDVPAGRRCERRRAIEDVGEIEVAGGREREPELGRVERRAEFRAQPRGEHIAATWRAGLRCDEARGAIAAHELDRPQRERRDVGEPRAIDPRERADREPQHVLAFRGGIARGAAQPGDPCRELLPAQRDANAADLEARDRRSLELERRPRDQGEHEPHGVAHDRDPVIGDVDQPLRAIEQRLLPGGDAGARGGVHGNPI